MLTSVRDMLSTFVVKHPYMNARQAFADLKGFPRWNTLAPPDQCDANAPHEVNGFSDGGVFSPCNPQWQFGSHGIHWPNMHDDVKANELEGKYSTHKVSSSNGQSSLELWGPVPGIECSSSRAELYALILALYRPGGIHIALDNNHVVVTAKIILDALNGRLAFFPINFCSVTDGDLWVVFYHNAPLEDPIPYESLR